MFNLDTIIKFLSKAGMRKIGVAVYFETLFCALLKIGVLPSKEFVELSTLLIVCVFLGNAAEHYVSNMYPKKEDKTA